MRSRRSTRRLKVVRDIGIDFMHPKAKKILGPWRDVTQAPTG